LVGVYIIGCLRGQRRFELAVMVNVVLYSSGVVGGTLLVASTFVSTLRDSLASLWLYVLIGGLAVLVVSVRGIYGDVFRRERANPADRL
jgi:O-antigen/teichoic acid export membrane protein